MSMKFPVPPLVNTLTDSGKAITQQWRAYFTLLNNFCRVVANDLGLTSGDIQTINAHLLVIDSQIVAIQADIVAMDADIVTLQADVLVLQTDVLAIQTSLLPPTETTPVLSAAWGNVAGSKVVKYSIDVQNYVHIDGLCQRVAATGIGETIFTLPAGARPSSKIWFVVTASSAFGVVSIDAAGLVVFEVGTAITNCSLSGISFYGA